MFVIVWAMGRGRQRSSGGGEGEFSHFKKRRVRRPFIKCLFEGGKISLADTGEEVLAGFDLRPDSAYVGCQSYPV